jgi:putative MATE family efflux protein
MGRTKPQTLENRLFSDLDLRRLLIPLIIEQVLTGLMGMVDTLMVSNVGQTAVSAVSLVDAINVLMIYLLSALATGGTIVCAQYIGRRDGEMANHTARQLLLSVAAVAVLITALCLSLRSTLLRLIFGSVEPEIMEFARQYFLITAISYPFIGLFNGGAALSRATGDSKTPMTVSAVSNLLNIAGNAILIFGLDMGVVGAALSTLFSRIVSATWILILLHRPGRTIFLRSLWKTRPDWKMIRTILRIGIPAGFENGLFQFGKLAVQSTVSTLGTTAISVQAVISVLEGLTSMPGMAVGLGLLTVVGQCMGAGRIEEAKFYTRKFCRWSELAVLICVTLMLVLTEPIGLLAAMDAEALSLMWKINLAIAVVKLVLWMPAFTLPNSMRAAGDVKFCAAISTATMWAFRVGMSWALCRYLDFGLFGVWIGWFTDWLVRAIIYVIRYRGDRWTRKHVLDEI